MGTKKPNFKEMAACITAAHASIKDVVNEVKNDQAMLDAMLDGSQCTSKACRCRVAQVAAKQFKIAVSLHKAREATIVRETKVICVDNAMKKGSKAAADRCKNLTINDLTMAKYKPQLVLRPKRLAKGVSLAECSKVAPADPCKKWKAEHKANAEIAKALKAEVKFGGGSTKLKDQGKKTLDNVAKILNKYPWMTITVEGHSDAPKGARCTALTIGRAAETEKYLKSKGVKNKMTRPIGKCGKKRAIEIIGNAAGRKAAPKGCGLRAEEDELELLQKENKSAEKECRDPKFKTNLLKSKSVQSKLKLTMTKLASGVASASCGAKERSSKEKARKERTSKEKKTKESASKEKAKKESNTKEGGSKEGSNKERKVKEVSSKAKHESANKEKKSKELRVKEKKIKEKSVKDEKKSKELRTKESSTKESKSKEGVNKEKRGKEGRSKEGRGKERKTKEKK